MTPDTKPSNPKDIIGSTKPQLDLVPDTLSLFAAMGFAEGAFKYGKFNWRAAGVRVSIYIAAMERHKMKFMAGEWEDPDTHVPHLASMLACIGIIVDAYVHGKLTDDRPPAQPNINALLAGVTKTQAHLKELFRDHNPHQHTIMDAYDPVFRPERRPGEHSSGLGTDPNAEGNSGGASGGSAAGSVQPSDGEGRDA